MIYQTDHRFHIYVWLPGRILIWRFQEWSEPTLQLHMWTDQKVIIGSVSVARTAMFVYSVSFGLSQFFPIAFATIYFPLFSFEFLLNPTETWTQSKICTVNFQPQIAKISLGIPHKKWESAETVSFSKGNSPSSCVYPRWTSPAGTFFLRGKVMRFFSLGTDGQMQWDFHMINDTFRFGHGQRWSKPIIT